MDNPTTSPVRQDSDYQSFNSKVSAETLYGCIEKVLLASQQKPRHFVETVDLQVALKKYNAKRDKRLEGSVRLPHKPLKKFQVCVLGDDDHCVEAKENELDCIDLASLKQLSKKTKPAKKLAKKYRGFMASESVINRIPRSLGPRLHRMRKFPTLLTHEDSMLAKLDEVRATIKFNVKKAPFIGVPVGNVKMSPDILAENINFAVDHIVPLLKRDWQNVRSLHIKSTMGPPQKLY